MAANQTIALNPWAEFVGTFAAHPDAGAGRVSERTISTHRTLHSQSQPEQSVKVELRADRRDLTAVVVIPGPTYRTGAASHGSIQLRIEGAWDYSLDYGCTFDGWKHTEYPGQWCVYGSLGSSRQGSLITTAADPWAAVQALVDNINWRDGRASLPVPVCYSCGVSTNLELDMFGTICRDCA